MIAHSLRKNHISGNREKTYKKQTATHLYCQIPSKFVLQLYSFDSVYSFVVFGKDIIVGGGEKGSDNTFLMQSFCNLDIHFVKYKNSKAFCYW
jgi:hypothetical protein